MSSDPKPTLVYALQTTNGNRSYVGATNDFARRLREHNGDIVGGARYTRGSHWSPIFRVNGLPDRRQALQLEKLFHRGFRRRRLVTVPKSNPFGTGSPARRAWYLYHALKKERFSQQKTVPTERLKLRVEWSRADFYAIATQLGDWGPASVKHVLL